MSPWNPLSKSKTKRTRTTKLLSSTLWSKWGKIKKKRKKNKVEIRWRKKEERKGTGERKRETSNRNTARNAEKTSGNRRTDEWLEAYTSLRTLGNGQRHLVHSEKLGVSPAPCFPNVNSTIVMVNSIIRRGNVIRPSSSAGTTGPTRGRRQGTGARRPVVPSWGCTEEDGWGRNCTAEEETVRLGKTRPPQRDRSRNHHR